MSNSYLVPSRKTATIVSSLLSVHRYDLQWVPRLTLSLLRNMLSPPSWEVYHCQGCVAELAAGKSAEALLAWKDEGVAVGRIGKDKKGFVEIDGDNDFNDSDVVTTKFKGVPTALADGQSGNKKPGLGPTAASVVGG